MDSDKLFDDLLDPFYFQKSVESNILEDIKDEVDLQELLPPTIVYLFRNKIFKYY